MAITKYLFECKIYKQTYFLYWSSTLFYFNPIQILITIFLSKFFGIHDTEWYLNISYVKYFSWTQYIMISDLLVSLTLILIIEIEQEKKFIDHRLRWAKKKDSLTKIFLSKIYVSERICISTYRFYCSIVKIPFEDVIFR